jgi:hypothetical protein
MTSRGYGELNRPERMELEVVEDLVKLESTLARLFRNAKVGVRYKGRIRRGILLIHFSPSVLTNIDVETEGALEIS